MFATGPQQDFSSSPDSAGHDMLVMILDLFWPIQATFVIGEPLCDVGTANSGRICSQGATLRCENPLFES